MSKKVIKRGVATFTGIFMIIAAIVIVVIYGVRWINPYIVFQPSPEFIQDSTGIFDDDSRTWLENQIKTKSKESDVAVALDCQQTEVTLPQRYVNGVVSRVVEPVYGSQKYVVITYFADTKKVMISTNLDQNGITSKTIENVTTIEELSKEVSYITLKLTNKMKPAKGNFTKDQIKEQIFMGCMSLCLIIFGANIVSVCHIRRKVSNNRGEQSILQEEQV